MTTVPFEPLSKLTAEKNLAAFIEHARNELAVFGTDLDFDSDEWDITAHRLADGERRAKQGRIRLFFAKKRKDGGQPLSGRVLDFAKAYVRSEVAHL